MINQKTMILIGAMAGIFTSSCIYGLDFDLFNPVDPEPTLLENLSNNPMIMLGFTLAGIAMAAIGVVYWKTFKTNEEIPDETLIEKVDEDKTITNFPDQVNA